MIGIPAYYGITIVLRRAMPSMALPGAWLLTTVIAVLGAAMMLAALLPALKATKINPVEALRAE